MDWLREILKNAGVPEDKLDSAIAEVNKALPLHFIPKDKYNEAAEAKKKLEADIDERTSSSSSSKMLPATVRN